MIRDPTPIFGPLRQPNLVRVIPRALRQATIAIGSLLLMLVLSKDQNLSRLFLLTFVPVFYPMILLSAHFLPKLLSRNLFKGAQLERVLLVGSPGRADQIRDWLSAKRAYGVHTVGILTEEENLSNGWLPVLGTPTQLKTVLATQGITLVIYLRASGPDDRFRITPGPSRRTRALLRIPQSQSGSLFSSPQCDSLHPSTTCRVRWS